MPRSKPDYDFNIHVDPSCLSDSMDDEAHPRDLSAQPSEETVAASDPELEMDDDEHGLRSDVRPSIESDGSAAPEDGGGDASRRASSSSPRSASVRTEAAADPTNNDADKDESILLDYETGLDDVDTKSELTEHATPSADDGADSSSQQGATDEDEFSEKSHRSSVGSYDGGSESGKPVDADDMTTITHSSRVSEISQYEKDDAFVPTARGTPRVPFRTPSDIRAMQMSSPTPSVFGSPRSAKRPFPTVSRLGTPSASAQFSPKRKSTPPRFRRQEAPLVLLHVTLLPLRWMWGEVVNSLDPESMSEQAKGLREAWRMLQDRVGDTVSERGVLLGHPQDDYEVLEERLLEALELPLRRRARILECGHYLGPSNESTLMEDDESEDDYDQRSHRSVDQRHWCGTCKRDIKCDSLGPGKIFRVKVYASNGLMKAGAWEACWKEMERVDVELEPVVDPKVQDEIVRLAATQHERELAQQEEAEITRQVAHQMQEERMGEQAENEQAHTATLPASTPVVPEPEPVKASLTDPTPEPAREPNPDPVPEPAPEPARDPNPPPVQEPTREYGRESTPEIPHDLPRDRSRVSKSELRRRREDERLREIYGDELPLMLAPEPRTPSSIYGDQRHRSSGSYRQSSSFRYPDAYRPTSPLSRSRSPSQDVFERRRRAYQTASLPELLLESVRVLLQDSKNVVIIALGAFVLVFALRGAPPSMTPSFWHHQHPHPQQPHHPYEVRPVVKDVPDLHHVPLVEAARQQPIAQPYEMPAAPRQVVNDVPVREVPRQPVVQHYQAPAAGPVGEAHVARPPVQETVTVEVPAQSVPAQQQQQQQQQPPQQRSEPANPKVNGPCESSVTASAEESVAVASDATEPEETETVTQKKIVRVVQTVTETEVEYQTATETVMIKARQTV
ncbi:hypothetical protein F4780DRAFT_780499 [Xylariomycetidae sp. FL0641]|nr:hypothetical protein F4780DRAFT_780499 [Xylariomycetidae sp. FL0641]